MKNKTPGKTLQTTKKKSPVTGKTAVIKKAAAVKKNTPAKLFPMVVIGASAGGLEAYSKILKNVRENTGMAFVIIQHMSPDYKSFLKDILARETNMEVVYIKANLKPEPDKVYVAPPNSSVFIENGIFKLKPRKKTRRHTSR